MVMLKVATLLLIVLLFSGSIIAQDGRLLLSKIEFSVREKAPDWKIEHKSANKRGVMALWKYGESAVRIIIQIADSHKQAHDWFQIGDSTDAKVIGPKGKKTKLKGFGSEAYIVTEFMKKDWVGLFFRRGKVYVQVYAPTEETVKIFAQVAADQMAQSNNSLNPTP